MVFLLLRKRCEIAYVIISIITYFLSKYFLCDVVMKKVHPGLVFTLEISIGNYGREFLPTGLKSQNMCLRVRPYYSTQAPNVLLHARKVFACQHANTERVGYRSMLVENIIKLRRAAPEANC